MRYLCFFCLTLLPKSDFIIIKYAHEEASICQFGLAFLGRNGL